MMKMKGQNKDMAIAIHDGLSWRAYILRQTRGQWSLDGQTEDPSRNGRQLPKKIIEFAAQSRLRRLRVLLSGEIYTVSMALPEDASEEELHTALSYEAQGELGLEMAGLRLAAARGTLLNMGSESKTLLAATFEQDRLARFASDAEGEAIAFECAGSLELAVLAAQAKRVPQRRLLFIRERTGFYAVPASDSQPFQVAMLPLGLEAFTDSASRERAEHVGERLAAQKGIPLSVVVLGEPALLRERLTPFLGACADIEFLSLAELEPALLPACAAGRVGGVDEACPWIGLPPLPRDPHRHGTVLCLAVVAAALCWVGGSKIRLDANLRDARNNRAAWESLESARKRAEGETKSLREQQNRLLAKKTLLERRSCLPFGLMPTLETLAGGMPAYSSLVSIKPRVGGGFEIVGLTQWQDGLPQLDAALREMAGREGLRREFGGLETAAEGLGGQRFRFVIAPGVDLP
jgi:hypothetical protein